MELKDWTKKLNQQKYLKQKEPHSCTENNNRKVLFLALCKSPNYNRMQFTLK